MHDYGLHAHRFHEDDVLQHRIAFGAQPHGAATVLDHNRLVTKRLDVWQRLHEDGRLFDVLLQGFHDATLIDDGLIGHGLIGDGLIGDGLDAESLIGRRVQHQ